MSGPTLDQRMLQAAYDGDDALVEALLNEGADPRARNERGQDAEGVAWTGYVQRTGRQLGSGVHPEPDIIRCLILRATAESDAERRRYDEGLARCRASAQWARELGNSGGDES